MSEAIAGNIVMWRNDGALMFTNHNNHAPAYNNSEKKRSYEYNLTKYSRRENPRALDQNKY
jgi:hypothetical protein